jgi:TonB-linked SusC/RagA family outer membrane protein
MAQSKEKLITLRFTGIPLSEAMKKIEASSGYTFFYDTNQIDVTQKVSLNAKDETPQRVMTALLRGTALGYEITHRQIAIFPRSQQPKATGTPVAIKGRVVDELGEPIIGANVLEEGTTNGVITDMDGNYTITAPRGSNLRITYIGYADQVVKAGLAAVVKMREDNQALQEVVVVGYGSMKKSDLTGGIATIDEKKLNMVSTNNLMDRLAGQVPGLTIATGNAAPGQDQTLRVRGYKSLAGGNNPLVILDGIPYEGSLGDLDPDLIESMTVLKDASSAAIYGSRAASGVILIQSKKGSGKAKVTYKGQIGMVEPAHRLNMMKGAEYIQYQRDLKYLKGRNYDNPEKAVSYDSLTDESLLAADEYANYLAGRETDWQDVIFRRTLNTNHQVSISGSTDKTTYVATIAHLIQNGVMRGTGMKRTNVSLNFTQDLNNWLKIGMNLQGIRKDYGGQQPGIESGLKMSPLASPYKEDGSLNYYPMVRNTLFSNPLADQNATHDRVNYNVILSSFAEIKLPLKGLKYRANFGYNYRNTFEGIYYGMDDTLTGSTVNGQAEIIKNYYSGYTFENVVTYTREFGKHKLDATGLFSAEDRRQQNSDQYGQSFVTDDSKYNQMQAAEQLVKISSYNTKTTILSYMLRINYSYGGRYMATLTTRRDGCSYFGENNRYATFPSGAVAWNIAQEKFMESTSHWLDMLKLRVSYGSNGNPGTKPYETLDRLSNVNYLFGDGVSATKGLYLNYNGKGNKNLKWETTYAFNAGLDFSFLNGRLNGNVDFYLSNTHDLLMSRIVPDMNGFRSILDNVGGVRNTGVEVVLNSVNIKQKNFTWSSTFNFSLNKPKITALANGVQQDLTNKWFVGQSPKLYYDYNMVGVWQKDDARWKQVNGKYGYYTTIDGKEKEIQAGAKPGSAKLEDVDGDGVISSKDMKIIGSQLPSFQMGLTNSFTYKQWYASLVLNGSFGQWRQMHDLNFDRWMPDFNYISDMGYWTESNPTNKMTSPDYVPYGKHSFYKKMNYVEVKNITVGFNFPQEWSKSIGLQAVRMDLSVNNLCAFSNFKNILNYENALTNQDEKGAVVGYPTTRSYMFGLNVTF